MSASNAKGRDENAVPAQILYDRSRTSGVELFKHLSTLATMRKTFVWLVIVSFLIGAFAAVRYVYLRAAIVPLA